VTHVEPWATGTQRIPSSAFCILHKLSTMRLTGRQLRTLLEHGDSPHIRALGESSSSSLSCCAVVSCLGMHRRLGARVSSGFQAASLFSTVC
jgi:hypothetical protein